MPLVAVPPITTVTASGVARLPPLRVTVNSPAAKPSSEAVGPLAVRVTSGRTAPPRAAAGTTARSSTRSEADERGRLPMGVSDPGARQRPAPVLTTEVRTAVWHGGN